MNFMGSEEYMKNLRDGDLIRKKIQKFKKDLDQIRKLIRKKQDLHDHRLSFSTQAEDLDLENQGEDLLSSQRVQLNSAINTGYELQDMAVDTKINLKAQGETLERARGHLKGLQADTTHSYKLLNAIESQRRKNKYVFWFVCMLLCVCLFYILK